MSAAAVTPASAARAARPRSAVWALTRIEGRRLLRHPLFVLGMVVTTATIVLASGELARRGVPMGAADRTEIASFLAGDCFVMLGAAFWTFLATFLAASRERRDAAHDFYAGQPVTAPVRTAAALLSLAYAGLAAFALVAVSALVLLGPDGALTWKGLEFSLRPLELVQGPLYVVMAGALGVLLGSWTRHVFVAVLAAVALFLPPIALVPWVVLGNSISRGFYGAISAGWALRWPLLAMAGVVALAAAMALARTDRRPRLALLAGAGLAAIVVFSVASPTNGLAAVCTTPGGRIDTPPPGRATSANMDFEHGDLGGWHTRSLGGGGWRVYSDAHTPPDPSISDPRVPFAVADPPQGRFAAVADGCGAATKVLYRDFSLDGRRELRFDLYYRSFVLGFTSPPSLDHSVYPNHQVRVDIMDPGAPILSTDRDDILDTVFRTAPGDDLERGPTSMRFDLSPRAGQTVRLRIAEVDNDGPLRVVVDDVRLDPAR